MSLGVFQKKLMESYRKGKGRLLMDALTAMMADAVMTLCNKCQSDRLVCALKPLCGDRKYTSLLADIGASEDEIKKTHAFCFSNHLSRLSDINENKEPLGSVEDAKFPLSSFINVVLASSRKNVSLPPLSSSRVGHEKLSKLLEQTMTRTLGSPTVTYNDDTFIIIGGKNGIIQVDLNREVATLNPENELIRDEAHLKGVVQILSAMYSLDVQIEEPVKGLLNLSIVCQMPEVTQEREQVAEELERLAKKLRGEGTFAAILQSPKRDHTRVLIELRPPLGTQLPYVISFSYSYLRNMILLVGKNTKKRMPKEQ